MRVSDASRVEYTASRLGSSRPEPRPVVPRIMPLM